MGRVQVRGQRKDRGQGGADSYSSRSQANVRSQRRIGLIEPYSQQENGYQLFKVDEVNRLRFIRMEQALSLWKTMPDVITNGTL